METALSPINTKIPVKKVPAKSIRKKKVIPIRPKRVATQIKLSDKDPIVLFVEDIRKHKENPEQCQEFIHRLINSIGSRFIIIKYHNDNGDNTLFLNKSSIE